MINKNEERGLTGSPIGLWLILLLVTPFASGYFLSFFSRSANVVLVPFLERDLGVTAGDVGLMSGVYFAAFASVQIPLGVLLDRYDPARVNALMLPFAVAGSIVFAISSGLMGLVVGRALIGLGVAGCLMTAFRCFSLWVPVEKRALYNGIVVAVGGAGNMMAFYPVEYLLTQGLSWRDIYWGLALVFVLQVLWLLFVVPRRSPPKTEVTFAKQRRDYKEIISHPRFIAVTPYACTVMAGFLAMQSLWFGPYLYDGLGLSKELSLGLITANAVGAVLGNLVIGKVLVLVRKCGGDFLMTMNGLSLIHFMLLLCVSWFDWSLHLVVWFLMGFFYAGIILYYSYLGEFLGSHLLGRAMTLGNGILFVLIFLFQVFFGYGLDWISSYTSIEWSYRLVFWCLLMIYVMTFLWQIGYRRAFRV